MASLPNLRFVEQHDPNDVSTKSQPYAYVADVVHEVTLSLDVDEIRGKGAKNEQWTALADLRDQLAPQEKVAWYIVVCGDEERWAPPIEEDGETTGTERTSDQSSGQLRHDVPRMPRRWHGFTAKSLSTNASRSYRDSKSTSNGCPHVESTTSSIWRNFFRAPKKMKRCVHRPTTTSTPPES